MILFNIKKKQRFYTFFLFCNVFANPFSLKHISGNERGDLLIFVSGTFEINTVVAAAQRYNDQNNKWIILPLHSALPITEQDKVTW